jgi:hypothetical protein
MEGRQNRLRAAFGTGDVATAGGPVPGSGPGTRGYGGPTASNPASYCEGSGFTSRPGDTLY